MFEPSFVAPAPLSNEPGWLGFGTALVAPTSRPHTSIASSPRGLALPPEPAKLPQYRADQSKRTKATISWMCLPDGCPIGLSAMDGARCCRCGLQRSWIAGFDHVWLVGSKTTH